MLNKSDIAIIRKLAARTAEIASLPVQEEKRRLWRKLNALKPERPMVMINQVCWNEIDDSELTLRCSDPECRNYENILLRTLFQWDHFPVDMVVEPSVRVEKAINIKFGPDIQAEHAVGDPTNHVVGQRFINQFQTEDDLQKIQVPHKLVTIMLKPPVA